MTGDARSLRWDKRGNRFKRSSKSRRWRMLGISCAFLESDSLEDGFGDEFDYRHDPAPEPRQIYNVSSVFHGRENPSANILGRGEKKGFLLRQSSPWLQNQA